VLRNLQRAEGAILQGHLAAWSPLRGMFVFFVSFVVARQRIFG